MSAATGISHHRRRAGDDGTSSGISVDSPTDIFYLSIFPLSIFLRLHELLYELLSLVELLLGGIHLVLYGLFPVFRVNTQQDGFGFSKETSYGCEVCSF